MPGLCVISTQHFPLFEKDFLLPILSVAYLILHTCFKKNASSSSKTSSSKKSSSSMSEAGTVARAALSLLLREKPLQNAWRYPPKEEKLQ